MKIQIISDLHQEFGFSNLNFDSADLIVLAGDTNLGTKGIGWVMKHITDKPVIYILGNHEYYNGTYQKFRAIQRLKKCSCHASCAELKVRA